MTTLTEFLLARIAETERGELRGYGAWAMATGSYGEPTHTIIPVRVRAECQAKRRIMQMHYYTEVLDHSMFDCTCGFSDHRKALCSCGAVVHDEGEFERPFADCPTLLALAAVYADHPDYRGEWRP